MRPEVVSRLLHRAHLSVTRYPVPNSVPWLLRRVLAERTVECVVDVGAHEGEFAQLMRKTVGYRGPIESYEPSAESFGRLTEVMGRDPHWRGHRVAMGAAAGALPLNVYESSVFNSLRPVSEWTRDRFSGIGASRTEVVDVKRLDAVVEASGPLLLKTDTQGFDLEVLRGATGLLDQVVALVTELSVRPIYEGAPALPEVLTELADRGFEPIGLVPVSRDSDGLRVIEFDGVFVRPS